MFTQPSVAETSAPFETPGERRGNSASLRGRVVALMRTVDERDATIASLMRQLHRARNNPSRSATVGRVAAGAAHEMQAPVHRAIEYARFLQRSFERMEAKSPDPNGPVVAELDCLHQLLDDLDRVSAIVRALENFSPVEASTPDAG